MNGDIAVLNPDFIWTDNTLSGWEPTDDNGEIDKSKLKPAEAGDWNNQKPPIVDPEHHTPEQIAKWQGDSTNLENLLNNWSKLFGSKTPEQVLQELNAKPTGQTLTPEQQEAINNYVKVKGALDTWTSTFGTETAQSIKNKLDAKPTGTTLTADQQNKLNTFDAIKAERDKWTAKFGIKTPEEVWIKYSEPKGLTLTSEQQTAINNYDTVKADLDKWIIAFPKNIFKKTPQELRKDYDDLKSRLTTAISNLQIEQGKNKTLTEDINNLKAKLGNPLENLIESKLREVIITDEWNYPYLVRSLESFLDWKNSQDKSRRVLVYKYWNTIRKNIEWLKNRLGGALNE